MHYSALISFLWIVTSIETEDPSSEKSENAVSVKRSGSQSNLDESLKKELRRGSTRRSMKKPGEPNDTDEKGSSPVSIFVELLVNSFQQCITN